MIIEYKTELEKLKDQIISKVREYQLSQLRDSSINKMDYAETEVRFVYKNNLN